MLRSPHQGFSEHANACLRDLLETGVTSMTLETLNQHLIRKYVITYQLTGIVEPLAE